MFLPLPGPLTNATLTREPEGQQVIAAGAPVMAPARWIRTPPPDDADSPPYGYTATACSLSDNQAIVTSAGKIAYRAENIERVDLAPEAGKELLTWARTACTRSRATTWRR